MQFSDKFISCMKKTLGDDFDEYYKALGEEPFRGLRINTLKSSADILKYLPFECEKTPFCDNGYYIPNNAAGVGNHPLHHAGAFYLQEPSASSAVESLDVQKGDRVLDLCAAPGGKSTQIAAALCGEGLLVSNEIVRSRAKILCSNLERLGVTNAIVTNARPDELEHSLCGFFDKVLVDAPCSGEGMIRREPNAAAEFSEQNRRSCAERQLNILESADKLLRAGGVMVYSTCTLSGEENEGVISKFILSHPYYELDEIKKPFGRSAYDRFANGLDIKKARRILPPDGGEGHFVARLIKRDSTGENYEFENIKRELPGVAEQFLYESFKSVFGVPTVFSDSVVLLPDPLPRIERARILRRGVEAGTLCKKRFEPSHALYMAMPPDCQNKPLKLSLDDGRIYDFLKGRQIECEGRGYIGVNVLGVSVGFGKASGGVLKNHYPKGLRILG